MTVILRTLVTRLVFGAAVFTLALAPLLAATLPARADDDAAAIITEQQEKMSQSEDAAEVTKNVVAGLGEDIRKAREALLGQNGQSDSPFARGLLIALFQPLFIASMFCLGLWAGQMHERLSTIWMMPVFAYAATVIGAFIAVYHSDWKPQFDSGILAQFQTTDAVTLIVGLVIGTVVALQLLVPPLIAVAGVTLAGLWLGFSQTADLGDHHNALLPFWAGFGLTGLLVNIFGIGFETFLESSKLQVVTRLAGVATLLVSFFLVAKII